MVRRLVILAVVVGVLGLVPSAEATPISTGDSFTIIFTETGPNIIEYLDSNPSQTQVVPDPDLGAVSSGDFILGALASPGFFTIASVTNIVSGFPFLTVDLSGVFFDATTLGLTGHIRGTFLGGMGGLHTADLAATDPARTWTLIDDHVTGGFSVVTNGTYTVAPVPEPATLLLLSSGFAVLAARRRANKT